ncbi:unnamed protein product [Toxocara canis]|uniref:Uncharacterized protein n=1 Tax=Toxocara canis TaxID=6265 RepID=A0A183UWN5_TOXCA|nr:unnamed protein product [Toxocara canis]
MLLDFERRIEAQQQEIVSLKRRNQELEQQLAQAKRDFTYVQRLLSQQSSITRILTSIVVRKRYSQHDRSIGKNTRDSDVRNSERTNESLCDEERNEIVTSSTGNQQFRTTSADNGEISSFKTSAEPYAFCSSQLSHQFQKSNGTLTVTSGTTADANVTNGLIVDDGHMPLASTDFSSFSNEFRFECDSVQDRESDVHRTNERFADEETDVFSNELVFFEGDTLLL